MPADASAAAPHAAISAGSSAARTQRTGGTSPHRRGSPNDEAKRTATLGGDDVAHGRGRQPQRRHGGSTGAPGRDDEDVCEHHGGLRGAPRLHQEHVGVRARKGTRREPRGVVEANRHVARGVDPIGAASSAAMTGAPAGIATAVRRPIAACASPTAPRAA